LTGDYIQPSIQSIELRNLDASGLRSYDLLGHTRDYGKALRLRARQQRSSRKRNKKCWQGYPVSPN
jgi:hypothetical protein